MKRNTAAANRIVEFTGPSASALSIDARFAICNMCTELGAITGIFVADEITKRYISRRKRFKGQEAATYFRPDADALYAESFNIDLGEVEPYLALFPSPDNVVPVSTKIGMKLDGCFIGACTTAEEDLVLAGLVLRVGLARGLPLSPGKRHVTPGSRPIMRNLESLGLLDDFKAAGFTIGAPGCSYCVGVVDVAEADSVWLSSQNRNFHDRMGKGAIGNLSSAATVAASAFSMTVTHPSELLSAIEPSIWEQYIDNKTFSGSRNGLNSIKVIYTEPNFVIRESGMTETTATRKSDGQDSPRNSRSTVISSKILRLGDFIDTDAIISSDYLLSGSDEELGEHCMEYFQPDFRNKVKTGQRVVVAGKGFGVGSSREQAPRALKGIGVQAVIARSFAFIYARNQPNVGLLGITLEDEEFYDLAQEGCEIEVDLDARVVTVKDNKFPFNLDTMELALITHGGMTSAFQALGRNVLSRLSAGEMPQKASPTSAAALTDVSLQKPGKLEW